MNHDIRHPLDPLLLGRVLAVAALVMVLIGGLWAVEEVTDQMAAKSSPFIPTVQPAHPEQTPQDAPVVIPADLTDDAAPEANAGLSLIDQAVAFIEPFEGRRHRVYRDSRGNRTVGVGFNLDRPGAAEDIGRLLKGVGYTALRRGTTTLTDAQIDVLLRYDVQRAIETAKGQIIDFNRLPRQAQLVLVDMTYNMGSLDRWLDLRRALAHNDYTAAADAMHDSRWRRQTGQRAKSLIELMHGLAQG